MRTSYSSIETYLQCPQKYKFQEIDKIRGPKSREAVFGTAVHAALNFMFKKSPLFPTLDEVVAHFRESWPELEVLNKESRQDPLKRPWTDEERNIFFQDGVRIIKRFYEKNAPWNFNVMDLESRFEVAILDEKTGETHILAGIIDRIDKTPDGKYEIIDYKTSKKMPTQDALDKNLQLSFYSLGLRKRWPHLNMEDIRLSLYFLKHEEKLRAEISAETVEKTKKHILETVEEIQEKIKTGGDFPPMPSPLCEWCSFRPMCPAWRHLYRKATNDKRQTTSNIESSLKEYFELKKLAKKAGERLVELQKQIKEYMNQEKLTRLFGDEGIISQKRMQRYEYDWDKVRGVLANFGKWEEILEADETKLKKILGEIPEEAREEIEKARRIAKEYTIISVTFRKVKSREEKGEEV